MPRSSQTADSAAAGAARAPIQLKMNFSGENPLATALKSGQFVLLIEQNAPGLAQPFDTAMALATGMARRIAEMPHVTGLVSTDRLRSEESHDPVDTAALLADASGKPCVMVLSGKGSDRERFRDCLARAASRNLRNLLPVTGDRSDKHLLKRTATGRPIPYPGGYFDSVESLRLIRTATTGQLFAGAAVNPFKYNAPDQYLQYYKMLRKLASGADFLMTHAGWDMKKFQELQWFLQMRETQAPVIARLMLLNTDDIQHLHEGLFPGVHVARLFAAALQRESNFNANQCLASQLHRLGLQAAGCRLMGYSGVNILGIRDVKTLEMVMGKVEEALNQYRTWKDWVNAWNEYHNFMEFAPVSHGFYAFANLMTPDQQYYDDAACAMTGRPSWPQPRSSDRWRSCLLRLLLRPGVPDWLASPARFLACGQCPQLKECGFRHAEFLCPRDCPKGLATGACGGSQPDGTCEFGHAPCFFHRVLAVAAARGELDNLETGLGGE
ncbi:MAG: methylenetetrahydrofolate reductase C-terminal domain-containing protein [Lentisphaeria bacterium]